MGRDCSIVVFFVPPNGQPLDGTFETAHLDREYCFFAVLKKLSKNIGCFGESMPASELMVAIKEAPKEAAYYDSEYVDHWRSVAVKFLEEMLEKHGPSITALIAHEEWEAYFDESTERWS